MKINNKKNVDKKTRGKMEIKKGQDFTGISIVYFCHDGKGNFVMGLRSQNCRDEHLKWDIGGGGLEFDDTPENTLKKEIKEEYGTDVLDYKFLGYRDVHREHEGKRTHWLALDFKVLVDKKKVRNNEPHKFEEVEWFSSKTIPVKKDLHSQLPYFFEDYKKKIFG